VSQEPSPSLADRPDGKVAAVVIAACAIVAILAVAQHPVVATHAPAQAIPELVRLGPMDRIVHGILIAVMAALLFGFSIFALRRGLGQQATVGGLIAYAVGVGAVIGAALIDGFVIPDIAARYVRVSPDDIKAAVPLLLFCAIAIQNLTKLGFIAMSAGIFVWSASLIHSPGTLRATGILGLVAALLPLAIVGYARYLNPHLVGAVVIVQAVWYLAVAGLLVTRRV
jgi:hypothetical protein